MFFDLSNENADTFYGSGYPLTSIALNKPSFKGPSTGGFGNKKLPLICGLIGFLPLEFNKVYTANTGFLLVYSASLLFDIKSI